MTNLLLKLNEAIKDIEITVSGGYALITVACYITTLIYFLERIIG